MTPSRILVTGATGFLGAALATALAADGHDVRGTGRTAGERLRRLGVTFAPFDLASREPMPPLLFDGGVDVIVHCAGLSAPWGRKRAFAAANIDGTRRLLDAAARHDVPHIVYVSSSSVYFRFRDQFGVREDAVLPPPVNAYAWSKRAAETLVLSAPGIRATVLRPRGIYGKGDTALLPRLLAACDRGPLPRLRGGKAVIDLTHVDDVVGAIRASLRAGHPDRRIYNVSGGAALPIGRIVAESAARTGRTVAWRDVPWPIASTAARALEIVHTLGRSRGEPRLSAYAAGLFAFSQTLDIGAIAADMGWRPSVSFDEGLRRTFG